MHPEVDRDSCEGKSRPLFPDPIFPSFTWKTSRLRAFVCDLRPCGVFRSSGGLARIRVVWLHRFVCVGYAEFHARTQTLRWRLRSSLFGKSEGLERELDDDLAALGRAGDRIAVNDDLSTMGIHDRFDHRKP